MLKTRKRKGTLIMYYAGLSALLVGAAAVTTRVLYRRKCEQDFLYGPETPGAEGTEELSETEGIPVTEAVPEKNIVQASEITIEPGTEGTEALSETDGIPVDDDTDI